MAQINNLKTVMDRSKVTVKDLAKGTGISVESVRKYVSGREPGVWKALKIAKYLGVNLENIWRLL